MTDFTLIERQIAQLDEQYRPELQALREGLFVAKYTVLNAFLRDIIDCKICGSRDVHDHARLGAAKEVALAREIQFVFNVSEVESVAIDRDWHAFREQLLNHTFWLNRCSRHKDANAQVRRCVELCKESRTAIMACWKRLENVGLYGLGRVFAGDYDDAKTTGDDVFMEVKTELNLIIVLFDELTLPSR